MEDEFTRLFVYMEEFRSEINRKLDEKASQNSVDNLTNSIDGIIKNSMNTI